MTVGTSDEPTPDAPNTADVLEALRHDLLRREAAIREGGEMPTGGISFGKRVGEGTSIAIERFGRVAIHDQIVHQLSAVELALERLDDGTYGTCEACGKPIPDARLGALPWASMCVACA